MLFLLPYADIELASNDAFSPSTEWLGYLALRVVRVGHGGLLAKPSPIMRVSLTGMPENS
jgi:hypothetical protein